MQSQPPEAIVHDAANLPVEITTLKVGSGVVRHVRVAVSPLVPVPTVLHPLGRRIELVCPLGSAEKFRWTTETTGTYRRGTGPPP